MSYDVLCFLFVSMFCVFVSIDYGLLFSKKQKTKQRRPPPTEVLLISDGKEEARTLYDAFWTSVEKTEIALVWGEYEKKYGGGGVKKTGGIWDVDKMWCVCVCVCFEIC